MTARQVHESPPVEKKATINESGSDVRQTTGGRDDAAKRAEERRLREQGQAIREIYMQEKYGRPL